jgi:hypothetical protein
MKAVKLSFIQKTNDTDIFEKTPPRYPVIMGPLLINRIPVTAPILAPLFGVLFLNGHIFLKN